MNVASRWRALSSECPQVTNPSNKAQSKAKQMKVSQREMLKMFTQ